MDTSFLSPGPITWAQLIALALFLIALGKGADWIIGKLRTGTKEAVSPLTIDMAAAKLEIRSLEDKLNAFKIEVARTYVTGDVITRLERRIDDMVTSVRSEMAETREAMLKAFMRRPPD
ncbi:hypothetical protein [Methylobacterium radiotolerans]|uniref:Uncharacterized protein n=1 Tax=Methylobacterium radiotolerans (strain ATCC 27329 / DSM 1819 / JCM 2831 / NBRC 15690 / NCIMB 10815 / 0-1) TaxID=426355 RepID=B1M1N2_METRJ|nr:hypothetical protein [Methylobacterium radiotolerans]ACB27615.1 hypothetical protein Mrad2831_5670 [Methylobacterium radiotolerans JCM 2831]GEM95942.1 hypothetical protein MRA01_04820 [Methylobacterium radiotolerans]